MIDDHHLLVEPSPCRSTAIKQQIEDDLYRPPNVRLLLQSTTISIMIIMIECQCLQFRQGRHTGKDLAFQQFQTGATTRRNV
jgi:hypothetical protein